MGRGRLVAGVEGYDTPAAGSVGCARPVPQPCSPFDDNGEDSVETLALLGRPLTLYVSYEEASPKIKRRLAAAGGSRGGSPAAAAPYRVILRSAADDELLCCFRGMGPEVGREGRMAAVTAARVQSPHCSRHLPMVRCPGNSPRSPPPRRHQVCVDERLAIAEWGSALRVAFPSSAATRQFACCLWRGVAVQPCSLAGTPAAELLAAERCCTPPASPRRKGTPCLTPPPPGAVGQKRKSDALAVAGTTTPELPVRGLGRGGRRGALAGRRVGVKDLWLELGRRVAGGHQRSRWAGPQSCCAPAPPAGPALPLDGGPGRAAGAAALRGVRLRDAPRLRSAQPAAPGISGPGAGAGGRRPLPSPQLSA